MANHVTTQDRFEASLRRDELVADAKEMIEAKEMDNEDLADFLLRLLPAKQLVKALKLLERD